MTLFNLPLKYYYTWSWKAYKQMIVQVEKNIVAGVPNLSLLITIRQVQTSAITQLAFEKQINQAAQAGCWQEHGSVHSVTDESS